MAATLYREACVVPFMSRFVVFGKRHEQREARLRIFCMTDDKIDKTLETQQYFTEVARSRDIEVCSPSTYNHMPTSVAVTLCLIDVSPQVLENKKQWLEMAGNLIPITRMNDDQLNINFRAFEENRLPFLVRIRDADQDAAGRIAFMREPKVPKGEPSQMPLCNLHINLPEYREDLVSTYCLPSLED